MAFKLKEKKGLDGQFQEITSELIDEALGALSQRSAATRGRGVHTARKKFKKLRAVLRLIRNGLGDKTYDREDNCLRKSAKPLSSVRDADAMIESLDGLLDHFGDQVTKGSFKTLRNKLVSRRRELRKEILEKQDVMSKVSVSTKKAQKRIRDWPSLPDRFDIFNRALRDSYQQGQRDMKVVLRRPTDENFHEWRKSVKYLRYQLQLFEAIWPPLISEMVEQAHLLTNALGADHDLVVLGDLSQDELKESMNDEEAELLSALINKRRAELKNEALALGQRFYAEKPRQFSQRLKDYWKVWQNEVVEAK
jgi:CHAD domain-containing protein